MIPNWFMSKAYVLLKLTVYWPLIAEKNYKSSLPALITSTNVLTDQELATSNCERAIARGRPTPARSQLTFAVCYRCIS